MRILVVENDSVLGTFLERGFNSENYSVDLVADSEAAKALVRERSYGVAVLDVNIPGSGILDVLHCVRSQEANLPVLILTNSPRHPDSVETP